MEFDFPLQDTVLPNVIPDRLQLDASPSGGADFNPQPPETDSAVHQEEEDKRRSQRLQELTELLLKERRKLELNQMLQMHLYERVHTIDTLLARGSMGRQGREDPAPAQNALSIQETPEADLADRQKKTRQLLLSFPPSGSTFYFTRQRHNYPRFLSSDGKPLTHSTNTSAVYSQRWSETQNKRLHELVVRQCTSLLHVHSPSLRSANWVNVYRSAKTDEERNAALQQLLPSLLDQFSWEQIAHELDHTTTDCFVHWLNCCDSSINNSEWSLDEDARLQLLAQESGERHWVRVALRLGSGRTPFQCFSRFVRVLEMKDYNRKWTVEEDQKVLEGVNRLGTKCWKQIASSLPGRTWIQCRSRYYQSLLQAGKKGRWSDLENCRLLLILLFFGMNNWIDVSRRMLSRNSSQCRDRWVNVLCPTNRKAPWSRKEDQLLLRLCERSSPIVWKEVCKHLPGRTADACKSRYNILSK